MRIGFVALALAACGESPALVDAFDRERVALVPVTPKHDVDILYVIDDSPSTLHVQRHLMDTFQVLIDELARGGTLPSLHVGAITSDLGVLGADDAQPGSPIGSGPGSCSGVGKNGALQVTRTVVDGNFISDIDNGDGTRTTNYSGSITSAFPSLVAIGSSGCGFEQPLEAMRRALDNHPSNVGFLRPDATLVIIPAQDEDDCSMSHSTLVGNDPALGPLQSFRCTRFGVLCANGGTTTDEMNVIGDKSGCHWNEDSAYLTPRARYETFLRDIKRDPRDVLLMPIAAGATSLTVEQRTPPGGGTAIPALQHECDWSETFGGSSVADPGVRMRELAGAVARGRMESVCTADYAPAQQTIAREIRGMLGDSCLTRDILLPADCRVFDETLGDATELQPCSTSTTTNCYSLVEDPACTTSQHLRVDVVRSTPPPADTMVAVRCRL